MARSQSGIILDIAELSSSPSNPAAGYGVIYPKTDGFWYTKTSAGVETKINPAFAESGTPQSYTGTIAWTGTTAPSGSTSHQYFYTRSGNTVHFVLNLYYTVAGSALTSVRFQIPTSIPQPIAFGGLGGGANHHVYAACGYMDTGTNGTPPTCRAVIGRNAANDGWDGVIIAGSQNSQWASFFTTYLTS